MEWTRIAGLTPCPTYHLLILDGLVPTAYPRPCGLRRSKPERSLCLHALSSFQRTSLTRRSPAWAKAVGFRTPVPLVRQRSPPTTTGRLQANLSRLLESSHSVNPLSRASAA